MVAWRVIEIIFTRWKMNMQSVDARGIEVEMWHRCMLVVTLWFKSCKRMARQPQDLLLARRHQEARTVRTWKTEKVEATSTHPARLTVTSFRRCNLGRTTYCQRRQLRPEGAIMADATLPKNSMAGKTQSVAMPYMSCPSAKQQCQPSKSPACFFTAKLNKWILHLSNKRWQ